MQHVRNLGQMIRKTASHLVKETKGTQSAKLVKRYVYHNVFNKALYYFHLQIKVQKTELSTYNNVEEGSRTKQNKKQRRENLQCIQVWIKSLFPFFRYHKQSVWFSSLTQNGPSLSANCLYIHLFGTCTLPFKPKCSFYTAPKCARSLGSEWTKQIKVQEQKAKKKRGWNQNDRSWEFETKAQITNRRNMTMCFRSYIIIGFSQEPLLDPDTVYFSDWELKEKHKIANDWNIVMCVCSQN